MGTPTYATREAVKRALQSLGSRDNSEVDEALQGGVDDILDLTKRLFYPRVVSLKFPWPDIDQPALQALWLDPSEELISITTFTSGGVVVPTPNLYLEPVNQGPPYDQVAINRATNSSLVASGSGQRSIQIDGVAGYRLSYRPAGALAEDLDSSETGVDITDSNAVGVGDLLLVDSEWMIVTEKDWLATGQTLQTPVGANHNERTLAVTTGSAFKKGEYLLLDAETVEVTGIAGNNLIVTRAVDGSVLAAHTGSTIFALRTATVERAALGSTAAAHTNGTAIQRFAAPSLVRQYNIAAAVDTLLQQRSGYSRTVGSGDAERNASGAALSRLRAQLKSAHGVQMRSATI